MSNQLPLDAYWMPYTGNRQFKRDPRIIVAAQMCGLRTIEAADS